MQFSMQIKAKSLKAPAQTGVLQRKCTQYIEEEKVLQRQAINQTEVSDVPEIVHDVLRSPGQPLDTTTRAFMETRFGHDFSQVRVHTDTRAAESARAVNALAYTVGRNIVFDTRQYAPATTEGKQLLAHELTHVIQQNSGAKAATGAKPTILESENQFEQEADQIANQIDQKQVSLPVQRSGTLMFQRQADDKSELQKTLSNVDLSKPVDKNKVTLVNTVNTILSQSTLLKQYVKNPEISAQKVYLTKDKIEFENAFIRLHPGLKNSESIAQSTNAFYHEDTDTIYLKPESKIGSTLHESIHKFQNPKFRNIVGSFLSEGLTQYFTDKVTFQVLNKTFKDHGYERQLTCARKLVNLTDEKLVAEAYFSGGIELLDKVSKLLSISRGEVVRRSNSTKEDPIDIKQQRNDLCEELLKIKKG